MNENLTVNVSSLFGRIDNGEIMKIAKRQSAIDLCCAAEDFDKNEGVTVISKPSNDARKYLELPFSCQMVSYGTNVVASVSEEFYEIAKKFVASYPKEHCFETPNMHVLDDALLKKGQRICFMAEYFLPDVTSLCEREITQEVRVLEKRDFDGLYLPEWSNALCEKRKHLDVLGVGAYDKGRLVGLAGASADCDSMWQIGIDVLPEYRRMGIASTLTSRLAIEVFKRGRVPFYCAAWCNVASVRNAIKSGFRPAWVEMTAKPVELVNEFNGVKR